MFDKKNKLKVAIIVVGYNRILSIKRLLDSLLKANYDNLDVPLVISIDKSDDFELYSFVENFQWPFGDKFVNIQTTKLGLKDHIFKCGSYTKYFKAIILLEDDIFVSPEFYRYIDETLAVYGRENKIAGISLYKNEFNGFVNLPFSSLNVGSDVFLMQAVTSWGECWNERMWNSFMDWNESNEINFEILDMPNQIKTWTRAWSKYYYAYLLDTDKYFVFPQISLSTNFNDGGEHGEGDSTIVQVDLLFGKKKYNLLPISELVKYDIYSNNKKIYKYLDKSEKDLCIDLYGNNENIMNKRYLLSINQYKYKVIDSYGLALRPHELNILMNIFGDSIYLYDTHINVDVKVKKQINLNTLYYHLRGFKRYDIYRHIVYQYRNALLRKIKKLF